MKLLKLETQEQFNQLKKDDFIILFDGIIFSSYFKCITPKNIIVLEDRRQTRFDINDYLKGTSRIKEVYLMKKERSDENDKV